MSTDTQTRKQTSSLQDVGSRAALIVLILIAFGAGILVGANLYAVNVVHILLAILFGMTISGLGKLVWSNTL